MSKKEIKLTYTEVMKEQDKLWEGEIEDRNLMESLFNQIIKEAKTKGFTGYCKVYQGPGECICEVFDSEEEFNKLFHTDEERDMLGFCKALISNLEERLNREIN